LVSHTNEENRLKVSEVRVVGRIYGPKREEMAEGWRGLHNEELRNLYASPDIIIRVIRSTTMRWAAHVARMCEMRNLYKIMVGKPEGKRPLGRSRRTWER
jgi:hypothetical protein